MAFWDWLFGTPAPNPMENLVTWCECFDDAGLERMDFFMRSMTTGGGENLGTFLAGASKSQVQELGKWISTATDWELIEAARHVSNAYADEITCLLDYLAELRGRRPSSLPEPVESSPRAKIDPGADLLSAPGEADSREQPPQSDVASKLPESPSAEIKGTPAESEPEQTPTPSAEANLELAPGENPTPSELKLDNITCPHCRAPFRQTRPDGLCIACGQPLPGRERTVFSNEPFPEKGPASLEVACALCATRYVILDPIVPVYAQMQKTENPLAELHAGDVLEIGAVHKPDLLEWVEVVSKGCCAGYVLGDVKGWSIKLVVLFQVSVDLHESPMIASPTKATSEKGTIFFLLTPPDTQPREGTRQWFKVRDANTGTEGWIDGETLVQFVSNGQLLEPIELYRLYELPAMERGLAGTALTMGYGFLVLLALGVVAGVIGAAVHRDSVLLPVARGVVLSAFLGIIIHPLFTFAALSMAAAASKRTPWPPLYTLGLFLVVPVVLSALGGIIGMFVGVIGNFDFVESFKAPLNGLGSGAAFGVFLMGPSALFGETPLHERVASGPDGEGLLPMDHIWKIALVGAILGAISRFARFS